MGKNGLQVAIDGPASAGKSTVAKRVAKDFNYIYCDTGAMYRAITFKAIQNGLVLDDEAAIVDFLKHSTITFKPGKSEQQVFVDGKEVTDEIRSTEVTNNVSTVAALSGVRAELVTRQHELAENGGIVMDGRDIGTTVLPDADVKIFLVASVDERAERRYKEDQEKGIDVDLDKLKKDIEDRDYKDSHRKVSPLRKAADAFEIDTTSMTIDQVVYLISVQIKDKIEE